VDENIQMKFQSMLMDFQDQVSGQARVISGVMTHYD
jgi:hypothetical protein